MNMFAKHGRSFHFITLLIPLFLAFVGMKVTDLSRQHKPKPMRRAVLDRIPSRTIVHSVVKVAEDPAIAIQLSLVFRPVVGTASQELHHNYLPVPPLSLGLSPPRAPPGLPPLA